MHVNPDPLCAYRARPDLFACLNGRVGGAGGMPAPPHRDQLPLNGLTSGFVLE